MYYSGFVSYNSRKWHSCHLFQTASSTLVRLPFMLPRLNYRTERKTPLFALRQSGVDLMTFQMRTSQELDFRLIATSKNNVLREHAPTPPSLQYLPRSNLSFPAYTFKTLSYASEVSLSFSRSNVFWPLIICEQVLSAFCNSADLHCLLIFFSAGFPTESIISSFLQHTHFFPRRNT